MSTKGLRNAAVFTFLLSMGILLVGGRYAKDHVTMVIKSLIADPSGVASGRSAQKRVVTSTWVDKPQAEHQNDDAKSCHSAVAPNQNDSCGRSVGPTRATLRGKRPCIWTAGPLARLAQLVRLCYYYNRGC